ncbi:MAG: hypothetical protein C0467_08300 [Planctomycetaceae bacterium]|nr:hypothetical protein [Planctomycetaceae bacterium]
MGDRLAAWASLVADRVFGPVFTLDATRVGRRFSTFLIRWAYLLVLVGVLAVFYRSWRGDLNAPGGVVHPSVLTRFAENFFWVYSVTQFLVIATLTPAFTAATITDEKERKTLHFLLVTDLTGREIVFGKLAARIGALLTLVIAGLPIVSLMQFFGGIEPRLLLVSLSMTISTVLSLSALSVAASVLMARTRDAVLLAYALPVAYLYLSFAAVDGIGWSTNPQVQTLADRFVRGNPFIAGREMGRTLDLDDIPPAAVWYVGFHVVVAVFGMVFAAWRIRASVRREGGTAAPRSRAGMMMAWVLGRRSRARWHPVVTDDPIRWREIHVEPGSNSGILHRVFFFSILVAVFVPFFNIASLLLLDSGYGQFRSPLETFRSSTKLWVCTVTCLFGILMLLRATVRGASAIAGERDRDTWVSLIGTPLTVREILNGKWAGCVWGQRDAMILLGTVWAIGVLTGSVNVVAITLTGIALGAYLSAFAALGISCSADARSSRVAIGRAVPTALLLLGGYWFVLGCCCAGAGWSGAGELVGYASLFIAACTPVVVLAALPAMDSEILLSSRDGILTVWFLTGVAGVVVGTVGWGWLAMIWSEKAHAAFAKEANRDHEIPGARPRGPRSAPQQGGQLDNWRNGGST